ncbi:hypothetical protein BWQ96_10576 [Gracilariopsis chorda]|uniref:Uncharacterized protein n=1 Tax=Gracilariopsis chorda TaxID=448386 RepID=A0A2V3IC89_9FLOR|nr:hypothetical protein BWQ96_10576 [Gracilariopsis chorda]|eukprot:PXF39722.1 hypothetical protein BWQ96_10576 [Gracilariopsis chorda]
MEAACDFSALHCPSTNPPPPSAEKTVVKGWEIERDIVEDNTHPCFDHGSASYTVPADGLYKIVVELIPLGGPAIFNDNNQRQIVPYSLCLQEPPNELDDQIIRRYHDIGNKLAKVEHIKAGTTISCIRMPNVPGDECIRFKVEIILRKRKRDKREPIRKEKKNRKRMLRRQTMAHHLTTLSPMVAVTPRVSMITIPIRNILAALQIVIVSGKKDSRVIPLRMIYLLVVLQSHS